MHHQTCSPDACDTCSSRPGLLLDEIALTAVPPAEGSCLPDQTGSSLASGPVAGILDMREQAGAVLLSFRREDGYVLWQEAMPSREAAASLAGELFGVSPEKWCSGAKAASVAKGHDSAANPTGAAVPFTSMVQVTRLTREGSWALWIGFLLSTMAMMGAVIGSAQFARHFGLGEDSTDVLGVVFTMVSFLPAFVVGFFLPFWVQSRFFRENEFSATTQLTIDSRGINLEALGQLPWTALNAIDMVNTESGEPEAVILVSDTWGKLMFRAAGSSSNIEFSEKMLKALFAHWVPDHPATDASSSASDQPAIFHLLPIRRWSYDVLYYLAIFSGMATFVWIMAEGRRGLFSSLVVGSLLGFLVWLLIISIQDFWALGAANRARAFILKDHWLSDNRGQLSIDLRLASVEWVYLDRLLQELDYLKIRVPGQRCLRLTAFDARWNEFVLAVHDHAASWHGRCI